MTENTNDQNRDETNGETLNESTGELTVRNPDRFTDAQLSEVTDLSSLGKLLGDAGVSELEDVADYGSGFQLLEDKSYLIGVPFAIVEWRWNTSDKYDQEFASIQLLTTVPILDGSQKFIINDGSVKEGIAPQLRRVQAKRVSQGNVQNSQRGLLVKHGLSRSGYKERGVQGSPDYRPAGTTFFLAMSPVKR